MKSRLAEIKQSLKTQNKTENTTHGTLLNLNWAVVSGGEYGQITKSLWALVSSATK